MCDETKSSPEISNNLKLYGIKFTDFLLFQSRLSTMYISEIKIKQYIVIVQAIYQNIFPEVLEKTKVFYWPRSTTEGNRTLWSFPIPRGRLYI